MCPIFCQKREVEILFSLCRPSTGQLQPCLCVSHSGLKTHALDRSLGQHLPHPRSVPHWLPPSCLHSGCFPSFSLLFPKCNCFNNETICGEICGGQRFCLTFPHRSLQNLVSQPGCPLPGRLSKCTDWWLSPPGVQIREGSWSSGLCICVRPLGSQGMSCVRLSSLLSLKHWKWSASLMK